MRVVEYFSGKNIFITGGSGFLGKVLIEKLLRSCEGIGNIYVLLRSKKGKSIEERLTYIKRLPLFDKLRETNPDVFKKLIPINGDVMELKLETRRENPKKFGIMNVPPPRLTYRQYYYNNGNLSSMSEKDRQLIIDKVHIVYHTAASVKFDDPLKYAIIVNVRGTRELVDLASELKNLSLLVHVSTAYCNCDKMVVDEILYPAPADWRDAIRMAEEMDDAFINTFSEKYINPLPNTYTFAKALGEHVVTDMCKGKLPAAIVRPTVVISAVAEPLPGWIDNFNGPVGLLVAGGKGILRTVLGNEDCIQDFIPVDTVANALILTATAKNAKGNIDEVDIYHASKQDKTPLTTGEMMKMGTRLIWDSPFSEILWYPRFSMTKCWYNYYIQVILFHMLPAFFIDTLLRIFGRKPMLFSIQRKVYIANVVLEHFVNHTWTFIHTKAVGLLDLLEDDEKDIFGLQEKHENMDEQTCFEYFRNGKIFGACFILKEKFDFTRTESLKNLKRLWIIDIVAKTIFLSMLMWIVFIKIDILRVLYTSFEKYISNL